MTMLLKVKSKVLIFLTFCLILSVSSCTKKIDKEQNGKINDKPNIIFILADDLGYGDIGVYNPESKIPTPNIDKLAMNGIRFTDAHAADVVCSPSRYSLLTGRYSWRTPLKRGTTATFAGPLIENDRLTVASLLKEEGYHTACIGKWHIGMSFTQKDGHLITSPLNPQENASEIDLTVPIKNGPNDVGFDYFFGTAACPTNAPIYAYIENDKVLGNPTKMFEGLDEWMYGRRPGLISDDFDFERTDLIFLDKSKKFISGHVKNSPNKPFFLFHSAQAIHLPAIPAKEFVGKTGIGPLGDFCYELDWIVGELVKTVDSLGVADNTIIVFSSDNGPETPSWRIKNETGHDASYSLRGMKRDGWEGGHRVPFIVKWPKAIKGNQVSDEIVCQTDFLMTCAEILGIKEKAVEAEDSRSLWPILSGKQLIKPMHNALVHNAFTGEHAIRVGDWKLLEFQGSGSYNYRNIPIKPPLSNPDALGQLYNLKEDRKETNNLYKQFPEKVEELTKILKDIENIKQ